MKVALCLHGLVGNIKGKSGEEDIGSDIVLKIAHQHWDRYFLEPYKPDVFIHSWNTDLKDNMVKLFNPKDIFVEEQRKFNIPEWIPGDEQRKQNHYSKWFSNKESVRLMGRYETKAKVKYDLVIIARFDIAWRKGINLKKLKSNNFYVGGWHRDHKSKVKDFWFISSSDNIKKFSNVYDKIEYYCSPEVKATSKTNGISNHKLAATHLLKLNLNVEELLYCGHDLDAEQSDYPLVRYYYFGAKK